MIRREVYERVGGLDDGYFLFVEDMDWCRRIRDAGHEVVYVPEAEVTHRIGASRGPVPSWVMWERHRSMLRYVRKHFGWPGPLVTLAGLGLALRGGLAILDGPGPRRTPAARCAIARPRPLRGVRGRHREPRGTGRAGALDRAPPARLRRPA